MISFYSLSPRSACSSSLETSCPSIIHQLCTRCSPILCQFVSIVHHVLSVRTCILPILVYMFVAMWLNVYHYLKLHSSSVGTYKRVGLSLTVYIKCLVLRLALWFQFIIIVSNVESSMIALRLRLYQIWLELTQFVWWSLKHSFQVLNERLPYSLKSEE